MFAERSGLVDEEAVVKSVPGKTRLCPELHGPGKAGLCP